MVLLMCKVCARTAGAVTHRAALGLVATRRQLLCLTIGMVLSSPYELLRQIHELIVI